MKTYYYQETNQTVQAKKVKDLYETFISNGVEVLVSKGNYIVTFEDGTKIGVRADEFASQYGETINKDVIDE